MLDLLTRQITARFDGSRLAARMPAMERQLQLLRHLIVDSVWRYRRTGVLALGSGMLSLGGQVGALLTSVWYASLLEAGEPVTLVGRTWDPRTSVQLLALVSAAVAVLLLAHTALNYYSRLKLVALRRDYEVFCAERVLSALLREHAMLSGPTGEPATEGLVIRLARRDARFCGRTAAMLMNAVIPAVTLVLAMVALVYLAPALTGALFVMMVLTLPLFYRVYIAGAQSATELEEQAPLAAREVKGLLWWMRGASFPVVDPKGWLDGGAVKRHREAYVRRLKASEDTRFISNGLFAVAFFVIMLAFGGSILRAGQGWGLLLVYLIALRKGLSSFREVNQRLSGVTRFYPQLARYFGFVAATEQYDQQPTDEREWCVRSGEGPAGRWEAVRLRTGQVVALPTAIPLDRFTLPFLTQALRSAIEGPARPSLAFATARYRPREGRPFREVLGLPPDIDRKTLQRDLEDLELADAAKGLVPDDLDEAIGSGWEGSRSPALKFGLACLSAVRSGARWIFVDEEGLALLSQEACAALRRTFRDAVWFVVHPPDHEGVGDYGEELVAIVGSQLLGVGDLTWFEENREALLAALPYDGGGLDKDVAGSALADDEEDEDEDEM